MKIKPTILTLILCAVIICSTSTVAMSATVLSSDKPAFVIKDRITIYMNQFGIRDFLSGSGEMADENTVYDVIEHLEAQGVSPRIWDETLFYIFPSSCMQCFDDDEPVGGYVFLNEADGLKRVIMSGQSAGFNNQLIHELGHIVTAVYPDILSEYAEMRKYPYSLDKKTQDQLDWEETICEWFAEDWKSTYAYQDLPDHRNRSSAPAPGPEVKEFFKDLVNRTKSSSLP